MLIVNQTMNLAFEDTHKGNHFCWLLAPAHVCFSIDVIVEQTNAVQHLKMANGTMEEGVERQPTIHSHVDAINKVAFVVAVVELDFFTWLTDTS